MPDDPDASDAHYQELTRLLIRTISDLEREYNDAHERNRERLTRKIDNQRRRPGVLHPCAFCERTFSTATTTKRNADRTHASNLRTYDATTSGSGRTRRPKYLDS